MLSITFHCLHSAYIYLFICVCGWIVFIKRNSCMNSIPITAPPSHTFTLKCNQMSSQCEIAFQAINTMGCGFMPVSGHLSLFLIVLADSLWLTPAHQFQTKASGSQLTRSHKLLSYLHSVKWQVPKRVVGEGKCLAYRREFFLKGLVNWTRHKKCCFLHGPCEINS